MKKLVALLLSLCLILGLAACTGIPAVDNGSKPADQQEEQGNEENTDTPVEAAKVKFYMSYLFDPPADFAIERVQGQINDYMKNDLGITDIELELHIMRGADYNTQLPLMLAGGEEVDIMSAGRNTSNYVNNGYLVPLDDFFENELKEAVDKVRDSLPCFYMQGHYYALPSWSSVVASYRWLYNKDLVDPVVDMSEVDTWDEIIDTLYALKEAYPTEHFFTHCNMFPAIYGIVDQAHVNAVGTYTATIGEDTTLVSYYATDLFKKALDNAYEIHNAGLDDAEGTNTTLGEDQLVYTGSSKGTIMGYPATKETFVDIFNNNVTYEATFDAVDIGDPDMPNTWYSYGIAYTSKHPAAAAKFLNLVWTDEFIFNTLGFGTEGIDYEWLDKDEKTITWYNGLNQLSVDYTCIYTLAGIGDVRMIWTMVPGGTARVDLAYYEEQIANAWYPPAYGFEPDTANVATQVAALSNVRDQYYDSLTYGEVDPAEYLPAFLDALDSAGLQDVLTEYQSQLDAWLAK